MFKPADQLTYRTLFTGVELSTCVYGEKTLMAQFNLQPGAAIPVHAHPYEQTGILLSGRIVLHFNGVDHAAGPGDSWCIAAGLPHSARAIESAVVVEVFSPPREDYLG